MFIASVRIEGFRGFKDTTIEFHPGINALIGENNSGKTTVLRALGLIFDRRSRARLATSDFHRGPIDQAVPPRIRVTTTIRSSGQADTWPA
jgi:putative ATP-dependent endonuclease of the OLD family